jgi:hypothetical protein
MNRTRIALLGIFAVLVAVWVSSATLPPPPPPATPTPTQTTQTAKPTRATRQTRGPAPRQRDVSSFDLDEAAARLQARLDAPKRAETPARNPFEFGPIATPRRVAEPMPPPVAAPVEPTAPQPPPFALTGVAENKNGDALERTAILTGNNPGSADNQIYFAKVGDQVIGRYQVTAVGADAIELRELASGQIVRLGLR